MFYFVSHSSSRWRLQLCNHVYKETECALLIKQMINFPHPFHSTFLPSSSAKGPWVQIQPTIPSHLCNSAYKQKTSNPGGEQIRIDFWKCKRHNLVWTSGKRDRLEFRYMTLSKWHRWEWESQQSGVFPGCCRQSWGSCVWDRSMRVLKKSRHTLGGAILAEVLNEGTPAGWPQSS